jgi:acetyl-CoA acetyltransferase
MKKYGLVKQDYGYVPIAQRHWAAGNPIAAYRAPLSMEDYLNAPVVADPLGRYDCVPVVAGASAVILSGEPKATGIGPPIRVRAVRQSFNYDDQAGDGLQTGLRMIAPNLWDAAGIGPRDIDVASIYDDYPAMVYAQLADLGFVEGDDIARFAREVMAGRGLPVNTGGGMLSCGQAGSGSGVHGIAEVVRQLQGRGGERQVEGARMGVVSGYGMALYRYCACSGAAVFEQAGR